MVFRYEYINNKNYWYILSKFYPKYNSDFELVCMKSSIIFTISFKKY